LLTAIKHYLSIVRIGIMSQTEYAADFLIGVFGVLVPNVVDLLLLGILLSQFTSVGGWTIWEVVFLFNFYLAAMGLQNIFTLHVGQIETYVQDGTFDFFLIRPSSPLVQLIGKEISHKNLTHLVMGLVAIGISYRQLGLAWTWGEWVYFFILLLSGAVVLAGIVLALCSIAFWTVRSRIFLWGTGEIQEAVQHYPIKIFGRWFETLVTGVLPFAFINYYPTLVMLGKVDEAMHPLLPYCTPIAAVIVMALGVLVWTLGINRYQSTGS
jgi:ABC-2 type transport system permease protein